MTVGNHIIKMVNAKVRMASHHIKAGRNIDLPLMATVSVRYELVTEKDPRVIIEDPKKGLARLNKWKLEGREIAYRSVSPDPKNPQVFFTSVTISKRPHAGPARQGVDPRGTGQRPMEEQGPHRGP